MLSRVLTCLPLPDVILSGKPNSDTQWPRKALSIVDASMNNTGIARDLHVNRAMSVRQYLNLARAGAVPNIIYVYAFEPAGSKFKRACRRFCLYVNLGLGVGGSSTVSRSSNSFQSLDVLGHTNLFVINVLVALATGYAQLYGKLNTLRRLPCC